MLREDFTGRYSTVEAWIYETIFAPVVLEMARPRLESLCRSLPPNPRLLDVGCGGGGIPLFLGGLRDDLRICGIDLCPPQVARAQRTTRPIADRVQLQVASALELPFANGSFDAVLSVTAIKHWPSRDQGLHECLRVLAPGGSLLIVEVDRGAHLDDLRRLLARSRTPRALRLLALPLVRTFILGQSCDVEEFRELARGLPLEDARVERTTGMPGIVLAGGLAGRALDAG